MRVRRIPTAFPAHETVGKLLLSRRVGETADGKTVSEYSLKDDLPVFDGLSAANGRLYLATATGKVMCFAGKAVRE